MDEALSPHFTLAELVRSATADARGIDNRPPELVISALRSLCVLLLEPVRGLLASPLVVTSGYRCDALNSAVGGSPTSVHVLGLAADFHVPGEDAEAIFRYLARADLPFDQLLDERGCIHIGLPRAGAPRRMVGAWSRKGGLTPWNS